MFSPNSKKLEGNKRVFERMERVLERREIILKIRETNLEKVCIKFHYIEREKNCNQVKIYDIVNFFEVY